MAAMLEQRVLGAVSFVDGVTGQPVSRRLAVAAPGVRWLRSRQGLFVVAEVQGLEDPAAAFDAPAAASPPASVALTLSVSDPNGGYLARRAVLSLPRDPSPAADPRVSLFEPVEVNLYPAPAARVFPSWALVRAAVVDAASDAPLSGALLLVTLNGETEPVARGLSDARGEALVAVPGIPVTTWAADDADDAGPDGVEEESPVIVSEVAASVEAVFDPDPAADAVPDPEDLETRRGEMATVSAAIFLAPGRTEVTHLAVDLGGS